MINLDYPYLVVPESAAPMLGGLEAQSVGILENNDPDPNDLYWMYRYPEWRTYPKILMIGSTQFRDSFMFLGRQYSWGGYIVLKTAILYLAEGIPLDEASKIKQQEMNKQMVDMLTETDICYVLNVDGFIDEYTQVALEYAQEQGKTIWFIVDPSLSPA